MNIQLAFIVKIIGWILTGIPLAIFLFFSFHMLKGIAEDDEQVKGIVSLFLTVFLIGLVILLFTYLTDFFSSGSF